MHPNFGGTDFGRKCVLWENMVLFATWEMLTLLLAF